MSDRPSAQDARIAALRQAIDAVESTSDDLHRRPSDPAGPDGTADRSTGDGPIAIGYGGVPEGDDWMEQIPARYHHGEGGFDRRLVEELATVGVRCYTLNGVTKIAAIPGVVPILLDWLSHLEERIPGPEDSHRQAIRANLIRCLGDPTLRGDRDVVDILVDQLNRRPPLAGVAPDRAGYALATVATKSDFARVSRLIEDLPAEVPRGSLIEYMGRVATPEAREIALHYLDNGWTYFAIRALIAMKATGVRDRIAPYLEDPNAMVREYARKATEKLPIE